MVTEGKAEGFLYIQLLSHSQSNLLEVSSTFPDSCPHMHSLLYPFQYQTQHTCIRSFIYSSNVSAILLYGLGAGDIVLNQIQSLPPWN